MKGMTYSSICVVVFAGLLACGCGKDGGGDPECGDGDREGDEVCDGEDLGGETCESVGLEGGDLACNSTCDGFDYTGCTGSDCGDGLISGSEECDGANLGDPERTCEDEGFDGGTIACADDCTFDTSGCTMDEGCGDGEIAGDEVCDTTNLGDPARTCGDEGFRGGVLACSDDCLSFDTGGCTNETDCGNGVVEWPEECDGAVPDGVDCTARGFASGTVGCTDDCTLDVSGCTATYCGDSTVNGTEECDGTDFGSPARTCSDEGFSGGDMACTSLCAFDVSGCTGGCGNGVREGTEDCDGEEIGTGTCAGEGFFTGVLGCASDCTYDTSGCASSTAVCTVDGSALGTLTAGDLFTVSGDTTGATDDVALSCAYWAATSTPDVAYEVVVMERGRLVVHIDNTWHVIGLFGEPTSSTGCFSSELGCGDPFLANPIDFGVVDPGRYYIVVSDYSESTSQAFDLVITLTAEGGEVCNNGVDDDGDAAVDCADTDCASVVMCSAENCTDGTDNDLDFAVDCMDLECVGTTDCTGGGCTPDTDLGTLVVGTAAGGSVDISGETNDVSLDCSVSDGNDHVFQFTLDVPRKVLITVDQASGTGHAVGMYFPGGTGCADLEYLCVDISTVDAAPDMSGWLSTDPFPAGVYYIIVEGTTSGAGSVDVDITAYDASETDCSNGTDDDFDEATDCADLDCMGDTACAGAGCTADHDLGTMGIGDEVSHTADLSGATSSFNLSCSPSDGGDWVYSFTLSTDAYVFTEIDPASGVDVATALALPGGTGEGCADNEYFCIDLTGSDASPDRWGYLTTSEMLPAGTYYWIYEVTGGAGTADIVFRATDTLVETDCTDGADDNGNGRIDCADPGCSADPACPGSGVYEIFDSTSDVFDLGSSMLTFTPVTSHPDGFVWAWTGPITMFPYVPGSGTTSAVLTGGTTPIGDDDAVEVTFSTMSGGFPFYGATQTVLNVGSNGVLTLGSGNANFDYIETVAGLFGNPTVAPLWNDFNPDPALEGGGTITYDEYGSRAVVTWEGVPEYGADPSETSDFQAVLWDDGHIDVVWLDVACPGGLVGVADGPGGISPFPETDFH